MRREKIQDILTRPYSLSHFKSEILKPIFASKVKELVLWERSRIEQIELSDSEKRIAKSLIHYGYILTKDERQIELFEVTLQDEIIIERNKVTVSSLIRKHIWGDNAAFASFVYSENKGKDWRFSFISRDFELKDGQFIQKDANPKRYSYILGELETCKTAALRFEELSKEDIITIENIKEAFSVEKMSKKFFDDYRDVHYRNLITELTTNHKGREIFKAKTEKLEEKRIRDFAKKLLGRIVFLYFIQKKGWLGVPKGKNWGEGNRNFLQDLFKSTEQDKNFYYTYLTELFFNTLNNDRRNKNDLKKLAGSTSRIPFLNGGLFDRETIDDHPIIISPAYFDALFEFFNQYNFTVYEDSKDEQLIAVDPEMLGHIFENLLEDNKDKGAFYTPKEIVHYMCQSSLIEYLTTELSNSYTIYQQIGEDQLEIFGNETKRGQLSLVQELGEKALNKSEIEFIVKEKDVRSLSERHLNQIKSALDKVKICDPAIGSGAFPMGILLEILAIKERIAVELNQKWNAAEEKQFIIKHNIYGVDIEKGAVDIARLRFWLSLIVDEEEPVQLPNLDYRIMQGNSLLESFEDIDLSIPRELSVNDLGTDRFSADEAQKLTKLAGEYFDPPEGKDKNKIKNQIDVIVNDFIEGIIQRKKEAFEKDLDTTQKGLAQWSALTPKSSAQVKSKEKNIKKFSKALDNILPKLETIENQEKRLREIRKTDEKPFFLWSLYFNDVFEKGGFDILLANPPYVEHKKLKHIAHLLKPHYKVYTGSSDLSVYFFELGFNMLKQKGIFCYINTNKFFNTGYGKPLRNFLTEQNILSILNFEQVEVFEGVLVSSVVFLAQNEKPSLTSKFAYIEYKKEKNWKTTFENRVRNRKVLFEQKAINDREWVFKKGVALKIKSKIEELGKTLKNSPSIVIKRGLTTGFDPAFIIDFDKYYALEKADIIEPLLKGEHIKKYKIIESNKFLINSHNGISKNKVLPINVEKDFPLVYNHLLYYSDVNSPGAIRKANGNISCLKSRSDQGHMWYNLRNCAFLELFYEQKIIWPLTADKWGFTLDTEKYFLTSGGFFLVSNSLELKYILAILNSKLMQYYFQFIGVMTAGGAYTLKKATIEQLPITVAKNKKVFINIVDYLLFINKVTFTISKHIENEYLNKEFEEVIDALVLELYFPEDFQKANLEIAKYVERDFKKIQEDITDDEKVNIISQAYQKLREPDNEIRNNIKRMKIDLADLLMPILSV